MGKDSGIQWTHHTFNPWIGCTKISPGCANCYASVETYTRVQRANGRELWGIDADRHVTSQSNWRKPLSWNRDAKAAGERHRVFCASLSDVFEDRADLIAPRADLFDLIGQTRSLDWLLLTKRPENIQRFAPFLNESDYPNVWLGCTVEDQRRANERLPHLVKNRAAVHFISCEPLLERVDLLSALGNDATLIDWVIIGGESGKSARPFAIEWARDLVEQCRRVGMFAFVKQLGAHVTWNGIAQPGQKWSRETGSFDTGLGHFRKHLVDFKHGGDISEFPEDLRVREFPVSR